VKVIIYRSQLFPFYKMGK